MKPGNPDKPAEIDTLLPAEPPVPAPVLHVGQVAVSQPVAAPGQPTQSEPQAVASSSPDPSPAPNPAPSPVSEPAPQSQPSAAGSAPVKMPLATSAIPALAIGLLIVIMLLAVVAYAFFS